MSTVKPLFSQRLRDKVEKRLNEEAFLNMPFIRMLKKKKRIKKTDQPKDNVHFIHPRMGGGGARTFDRFTTTVATEKEKSIEARYTHGQYFDEEPVSGLDKILNSGGGDTVIFNNVAAVSRILAMRISQDYYGQLYTGDGTAQGTGQGQSVVGINNILFATPAGQTYATIPFTGNTDFWQHATVNGSTWVGNEYNRIITAKSAATLRTDEGFSFKPDFGLARTEYIDSLREVFFDKSNYQNPNPKGVAKIGSEDDSIEVDGIELMPDDTVPANTMYLFNSSSWSLEHAGNSLFMFDERPSYQHVAPGTAVLHMTNVSVLKCLRPRLNAVIHTLPTL